MASCPVIEAAPAELTASNNPAPPASPRRGIGLPWATRVVFLASGLFTAAWAPLIPLAKSRLRLSDGRLGLLLLCVGVGMLGVMPFAGMLTGRAGCRRIITLTGTVAACSLPVLATARHAWVLAIVLVAFGAAAGLMDVALNVHAVLVERLTSRAMMSGFHGLWSVGGILGAGTASLLLSIGGSPAAVAVTVTAGVLLLLVVARPSLLPPQIDPHSSDDPGRGFTFPRGMVLLLGSFCFVLFLAEGSVLDWSGVFLTTVRGLKPTHAGIGYVAFASAMTICRLAGDPVVRIVGPKRVAVLGSTLAATGFALTVLAPVPAVDVVGFALIGFGAANVVPVMFSSAGRQSAMPASQAIPAMTTIGYAGSLAGPAGVGLLAGAFGLQVALAVIAALLVGVAILAGRTEF